MTSKPDFSNVIKTVTKRTLLPGHAFLSHSAVILIRGVCTSREDPHVVIKIDSYNFSPESLREAADLFREMADILDENDNH